MNSDIWLTVLLVTAIVTIAVMMGALICFLFVKSTKPDKNSDYYDDSDDPVWRTSNHQTLDQSIPLEVVCSTTEIDHTNSVSEYDAESEVPEESSFVEHSSMMLPMELPLDASVEHSSLMLSAQLSTDA